MACCSDDQLGLACHPLAPILRLFLFRNADKFLGSNWISCKKLRSTLPEVPHVLNLALPKLYGTESEAPPTPLLRPSFSIPGSCRQDELQSAHIIAVMMTESQWVQFSTPETGTRKRAGFVCILCHSKKVRCDLQTKRDQGQRSCSSCILAGKQCRPRQSRRNKGRSVLETVPPDAPLHHVDNEAQGGMAVDTHGMGRQVTPKVSRHGSREPSSIEVNRVVLAEPEWTRLNCPRTPATDGSYETQPSNETLVLDAWSADQVSSPSAQQAHRGQREVEYHPVSQLGDVGSIPRPLNVGVSPPPFEIGNPNSLGILQPDLRQCFTETYFEYCYTWCPVLDRASLSRELVESPLLDNALALVGSHVRPPLTPHAGPAVYYNRARRLFYEDEEENLTTALKAISLFYWWAPRPPSVVHKHSSWWWTSVIIKHAQQAGFHCEHSIEVDKHHMARYIKRRIWWTAFARERLTAICQGKPCLINPEDCNIPPPSLQDFPDLEDKSKGEVFVYWVRLCTIIGRISKRLSLSANSFATTNNFPGDLSKELVEWVRSLPPHLQLPIGSSHTPNFNRDVHQLHLPYLAVIVVLHLTRTSQSPLQALPPATLAGSCIARILKDMLIRSETRSLMPITCWYVGMGFIALLQASRKEYLKDSASADLMILTLAIKELKYMWATAREFEKTFEQLRSKDRASTLDDFPNRHLGNERAARALNPEKETLQSGIDLLEYFPFVTSKTSVVAEKILAQQNMDLTIWDGLDEMAFDIIPCYQDFMEGLDSWDDPIIFQ